MIVFLAHFGVSMAVFVPQQNWVVVTEAICPAKPKILPFCPLPKKKKKVL